MLCLFEYLHEKWSYIKSFIISKIYKNTEVSRKLILYNFVVNIVWVYGLGPWGVMTSAGTVMAEFMCHVYTGREIGELKETSLIYYQFTAVVEYLQ